MIPTVKLMLVLATALAVVVTTIDASKKGQNTGNQKSVNDKLELELKNAAQKALDAIRSKRILTASYKLADRGQHVFNNGLLKIHHNVLKDLLKDVGGFDEQLENLEKEFIIPRNQTHRNKISTTVARFSSDEFYVDFNADVYGEYAKQLREAIVAFLKADISDNRKERNGIQYKRQQVQFIASQMVIHEVYVDPMARNRWLEENQGVEDRKQTYNQIRKELKNSLQNILPDINNVSRKIRDFLRNKKQKHIKRSTF